MSDYQTSRKDGEVDKSLGRFRRRFKRNMVDLVKFGKFVGVRERVCGFMTSNFVFFDSLNYRMHVLRKTY